jgi:hypothetical protein
MFCAEIQVGLFQQLMQETSHTSWWPFVRLMPNSSESQKKKPFKQKQKIFEILKKWALVWQKAITMCVMSLAWVVEIIRPEFLHRTCIEHIKSHANATVEKNVLSQATNMTTWSRHFLSHFQICQCLLNLLNFGNFQVKIGHLKLLLVD